MKATTLKATRFALPSSLGELLTSTPIAFGIALISIIGLSMYLPLFDLDEGAFTEATREMLSSGNWVSTYLNGEPRHDKPIFIYWLQALSVKTFGFSNFALRLPSMLAALLWIYAVYHFTREFINQKSAVLSIWVLSCSLLATVMFKAATADAVLNLFLCLIFFDIYRYLQNPRTVLLLRISTLVGLAFLTKGPIAVVLPGATCLLTLSFTRQWMSLARALKHPYTWLPFIAIVLPWHVAVYLDQGWAFFEGFYLGHNLSRFSSTMEDHGGSLTYYLLLLPFLLAPFSLLFIKYLFVFSKCLLQGVSRRAVMQNHKLDIFLMSWFCITFLIFSFSKTQLPHYLLYGLTPVFIVLARSLNFSFEDSQHSNESPLLQVEHVETQTAGLADILFAGMMCAIFLLLPFTLEFAAEKAGGQYDREVIELGLEIMSQQLSWLPLLCIALICLCGLLLVAPILKPATRLICVAGLLMLYMNFGLAPLFAGAQQLPVVEAANTARTLSTKEKQALVSYRLDMPSFSVYLDQIVAKKPSPETGDIVFTKHQYTKQLQQQHELDILYQRGGLVLLKVQAAINSSNDSSPK